MTAKPSLAVKKRTLDNIQPSSTRTSRLMKKKQPHFPTKKKKKQKTQGIVPVWQQPTHTFSKEMSDVLSSSAQMKLHALIFSVFTHFLNFFLLQRLLVSIFVKIFLIYLFI